MPLFPPPSPRPQLIYIIIAIIVITFCTTILLYINHCSGY